jgi:hypothetical protein
MNNGAPPFKLEELIRESEVYKKFPGLVADKELRLARQRGEIEVFDLRTGSFYLEEHLVNYTLSVGRKHVTSL